jgi:copper chaperone
MTTRRYTVEGMTCQHCVNAVTAELGRLPGVKDVPVDLNQGTVTVTAEPIDDSAALSASMRTAGLRSLGRC